MITHYNVAIYCNSYTSLLSGCAKLSDCVAHGQPGSLEVKQISNFADIEHPQSRESDHIRTDIFWFWLETKW